MREVFVMIEDVKVFRSYNSEWKQRAGEGDIYCNICEEKIGAGEFVSLLMCNHTLFPNVWIHDRHVGSYEDNVHMVTNIMFRYVEFMRCWNRRKIWGNL